MSRENSQAWKTIGSLFSFQTILISTCVNNSYKYAENRFCNLDCITRIQKSVKQQKVFESFESFKISETKIKISKLIVRSLLFKFFCFFLISSKM